jgi:hypothetical protein
MRINMDSRLRGNDCGFEAKSGKALDRVSSMWIPAYAGITTRVLGAGRQHNMRKAPLTKAGIHSESILGPRFGMDPGFGRATWLCL